MLLQSRPDSRGLPTMIISILPNVSFPTAHIKAPYSSKALLFVFLLKYFLPVSELQLVKPDRVRLLGCVSVLLIVNGYGAPARASGRLVNVQSRGFSIQGDGFEQQVAAGRPLYL